jgi:N-acylneuraminate cytidylyltransferase
MVTSTRTGGNVLALVPARGGSKSIPRKNLRKLAGHPLLAWAVAAGTDAQAVHRTVVSTDDPEMRDVAEAYGAEAPFLRPAALAQDDTPDLPVFLHCLEWLEREEGYRPDIVVQLRPTSPLRGLDMVDRAVLALMSAEPVDAVRTVVPSGQNPYKMWRLDGGRLTPLLKHEHPEPYNLPRQALPATYWQTGHVDVAWARTLESGSMTGSRIAPLVIDPDYAVDIDTEDQLRQAEWAISRGMLPVVRPKRPLARRPFKLVAFDFDGVMTDNRVHVTEDGRESVVCDRGDGMGLGALRDAGIALAVLSTETNGVVKARCDKLGIPFRQALANKGSVLRDYASGIGTSLDEVVFVGNDVNDLECMRMAGLAVAVADAHPTVMREAEWVLSREGGRGAVRELCDQLLEMRGT